MADAKIKTFTLPEQPATVSVIRKRVGDKWIETPMRDLVAGDVFRHTGFGLTEFTAAEPPVEGPAGWTVVTSSQWAK